MMEENSIEYDPKKLPVKTQQPEKATCRLFRPDIDPKKCTKCKLCIVMCPHDAIEIGKNDFPNIIYDYCTGCLVCLRECPWTAIGEEREK